MFSYFVIIGTTLYEICGGNIVASHAYEDNLEALMTAKRIIEAEANDYDAVVLVNEIGATLIPTSAIL